MKHSLYKYWQTALVFLVFLAGMATIAPVHAGHIVAVRAWPADDYTRITLEHDGKIQAKHFILTNPERLVVDIQGTELSATLKELISKIQRKDLFD